MTLVLAIGLQYLIENVTPVTKMTKPFSFDENKIQDKLIEYRQCNLIMNQHTPYTAYVNLSKVDTDKDLCDSI